MDLKTQIERATTGAELVALAETAKIALPGGFSKMGLDRKKRVLLTMLPVQKAAKRRGMMGLATAALMAFGSALHITDPDAGHVKAQPKKAAPKPKAAKPKKKRPTVTSTTAAADPVVLTRQVRRANERRTDKLLRSNLKAMAMKDKVQGGSAVVTMKDVRSVRAGSGMHAHS